MYSNDILHKESFIIENANWQLLKSELVDADDTFGQIKIEDGLITAFLNTPIEASTFNKLMFDKGITLSHLVQRKQSLEEQFLQLTDNN